MRRISRRAHALPAKRAILLRPRASTARHGRSAMLADLRLRVDDAVIAA